MLQSLDTLKKELQNELIRGWHELKASNSYSVYSEAFEFFKNAGLYEGLFRPHIPNPVYDNAAKEMGKFFLQKALSYGIYFQELFPGDFSLSTEEERADTEFRVFYLTAFFQQKKIGVFKISFEHTHTHFDFPSPPLLDSMPVKSNEIFA